MMNGITDMGWGVADRPVGPGRFGVDCGARKVPRIVGSQVSCAMSACGCSRRAPR